MHIRAMFEFIEDLQKEGFDILPVGDDNYVYIKSKDCVEPHFIIGFDIAVYKGGIEFEAY